MHANGWIMLRTLLNRFHKDSTDAFLRRFPIETVKNILKQDVPTNATVENLLLPVESIGKIHYSWLLPAIQNFPPALRQCSLSALPKEQAVKIAQILKEPIPKSVLILPIRQYFLQTLYNLVTKRVVLPPNFLPKTILSPLLQLKKPELLEMIDFLGIYDLAEEIRHLIDKKQLAALHACLSSRQRQFLSISLKQKEKVATSKLELERWDGSSKNLDAILHRRGLIRIAKALHGQHADMIWHLTHTIDTGRAAIILQYLSTETTPILTNILIQQVINVMKFLKAESKQ